MSKQFLPDVFGRSAGRDMFSSLQQEIDRVFSDFGRGFPASVPGKEAVLGLRLDVAETDKAIEVTADVPGVEPSELNVQLRDGVLSIKGEKKSEKDEKKKDYHLVERTYGMFERVVRLPADVDADKVDAKFEKGVLRITLPKKADASNSVRKIDVKAG